MKVRGRNIHNSQTEAEEQMISEKTEPVEGYRASEPCHLSLRYIYSTVGILITLRLRFVNVYPAAETTTWSQIAKRIMIKPFASTLPSSCTGKV
jgi:hypothetical protein